MSEALYEGGSALRYSRSVTVSVDVPLIGERKIVREVVRFRELRRDDPLSSMFQVSPPSIILGGEAVAVGFRSLKTGSHTKLTTGLDESPLSLFLNGSDALRKVECTLEPENDLTGLIDKSLVASLRNETGYPSATRGGRN